MSVLLLKTPGVIQTLGPVEIDPYWLSRGFKATYVGDRTFRKARGGGILTATGSPKVVASKWGRASGFGATSGTGTTDRLDGIVLPPPTTNWRTFVAHVWLNSLGGGSLGRLFQDATGAGNTNGEACYPNGTSLMYLFKTSTTMCGMAGPSGFPTGRWAVFSCSVSPESGTSTIYYDGAPVALSVVQADPGSVFTQNAVVTIGNRSSDSLRCLDGLIAREMWFDGKLNADEHARLARNPDQVFLTLRPIWVPAAGGGTPTLAPSDGAHAHTADNLALSVDSFLAVADAAHAHAADNLTLTSSTDLVVADASHAHTADAPVLSVDSYLAVADAAHAHAADNLTLTSSTDLVVADASHAHTADGPVLTVDSFLAVADAAHAHAADNLALTSSTDLVVADASHAHAADAPVLTVDSFLAAADAVHAHAADNVVLAIDGSITLTVADASHAHAADNVALTQSTYLGLSDSLHAHAADNLTIVVNLIAATAGAQVGRRPMGASARPANSQPGARASRQQTAARPSR